MADYLDIAYSLEIDKNNIKYMYIENLIILGVKNRYKGQGTRELNKLIDLAIEKDCKYIELKADTVQRQARGFVLIDWYKKFGFYEVDNSSWLVVMRKDIRGIKSTKSIKGCEKTNIKWKENSKEWCESENINVSMEAANHKYALFIIQQGKDSRWICHKLSGSVQQVYPKYTIIIPNPNNNMTGKYTTLDGAKTDIQHYYNKQLR